MLDGLLVQENIFRSVSNKPVDVELLNRCAYSADLLTVGDIMNKQVSMHQDNRSSCYYMAACHLT